MLTPAGVLKNTFGYDQFRPYQQAVIENVLAGRDTLAIMPTGGGKSLCYQIPAILLPGLTVVVSPLIALMKDQVEQLAAAGVPALFLNSTLTPGEYQDNMRAIRRGEVKLLYVAPETLLTPRIFSLLDSLQVSLLTIDEAHCISEWGHDFRPEYRLLVDVRKRYPQAVCLALTATATPRVRADITATLGFIQSNEFVASFDRANLYIEVAPKEDATRQALRLVERYKDQSGIIYCFSRKQVDELAAYLAHKGYSARPYHAGLEDAQRKANQEAFIRDNVQIIVATIAFGMGINKPNVRFILHYDLPKSIEGYYQEIGRAGRDGLPAHCLLLYSYADVAKQRYFIEQKKGDERRVAQQHLDAIVHYAEDSTNCRRKPLLNYFGEMYNIPKCAACDNCTSAPPVSTDITLPAQKFLSCVKRSGERFGAGHVIDILRGSRGERVLRLEHDKLSTYGIGADLSEKQWMGLARQLVQMGYLNQDGEYRTLSLSEKGSEALRERVPISGQPLESARPEPTGHASREKTVAPQLETNNALLTLLRARRKQMADEAGVPPYVIFNDKTLVEMAAFFPQSPESLLNISGVGQVKLQRYGEAFLDIIRPFCHKHRLAEKKGPGQAAVRQELAPVQSDSGRRYMLVGEAYQGGDSISVLMERYQVTLGTVLDNLTRYLAAGQALRCGDDLLALAPAAPDEQEAAYHAFDELGTAALRPIFERLDGRIDYDELKILRLIYLTHGNSG
jgi:ATP-dependent DNA helicase RecQ